MTQPTTKAPSRAVLIMEDDADLAAQWEAVMRQRGHAVTVATSRAEAEQACRGQRFDLVIADIFIRDARGVPRGDGGLLFTFHLRNPEIATLPPWTGTVPIMIVTGAYRMQGADPTQFALGMGANRALFKPIQPAELLDAVDELLGCE